MLTLAESETYDRCAPRRIGSRVAANQGSATKTRIAMASLLLLCACAFSGCSSEQLYAAGRATQRNQCDHIPDQGRRESCLRDASMSHDEYKRESEAIPK